MWWLSDSGRPQIYRKQTSTPVMGYGDDSRCLHCWCALIEMNRLVGFLRRIWDVFFERRVLKQDIILDLESWMWTHSTKKLQQACVSENDCSYKSFPLFLSSSSCSHDVRNVEHSLLLPSGRGFYDWNLTPFLCPISNRAVTHIKDSQRRITARP